jgi:hypothetical protein
MVSESEGGQRRLFPFCSCRRIVEWCSMRHAEQDLRAVTDLNLFVPSAVWLIQESQKRRSIVPMALRCLCDVFHAAKIWL